MATACLAGLPASISRRIFSLRAFFEELLIRGISVSLAYRQVLWLLRTSHTYCTSLALRKSSGRPSFDSVAAWSQYSIRKFRSDRRRDGRDHIRLPCEKT